MRFDDGKAIYLQITDSICENLLAGFWKPGDRIPSVREMAVDIAVNPNTVQRSYTWLQERDIIHTRRGIGYFVSESGPERARELKREEFLRSTCPMIAKTMALLNIDFSELKDMLERARE